MFKKLKPAFLVLILIILAAVYYFTHYMNKDDRTFKEKITSFRTEEATQIIIDDPQTEGTVDLRKGPEGWMVAIDGKMYRADSNVAMNILKQLNNLETKRFAGRNEDHWIRYDVTDTAATVVKVKKNNKELAKVLIGRFSYSMPEGQQEVQMGGRQQQGEMTTYVRLEGEPEVYAVDGFLKMNFNRDAATYRDRTLTHLQRTDITGIDFDYPEMSLTLSRENDRWMTNGTPADSAEAAKYISSIARLSSPNFLDQSLASGKPSHKVTLKGNNFTPVTLEAWPVADTNINYVIHSSHNPDAWFNGKSSDLFDKIFTPGDQF